MKILNELTVKNMQMNKKRTMVTGLGIVLSVALICAITTFVASFQNSMIARAKRSDGDYHIYLKHIPKEDQKYFRNNPKIEEITVSQSEGKLTYEPEIRDEEEQEPVTFERKAFSDEALAKMGIILNEGRMPENEQEILVSDYVWGAADMQVGNSLSFLQDGEEVTYQIVGRMEVPAFDFHEESFGHTVITKLCHDTQGQEKDFTLKMKHPREAYRYAEELRAQYGEENVHVNDELLAYQGVTRSNDMGAALFGMAAIVIGIIIVTSVFVIRNSFYISITERLRQYGMLASIGATSKQIYKSVLFEGVLMGLFAIPIGVASGVFAIWIVIVIVNGIIQKFQFIRLFELRLYLSVPAILIAVLIAVLTIYFSSLAPAKKAAKIAPIDAIRETNEVKISGRKLRTSRLITRLFGVEGEIADKNLKRSRKKYRTTVLSIFVSVVLFISISSVIQYGFKIGTLRYEQSDHNLEVSGIERLRDEENESYLARCGRFYEKVQNLEEVQKSSVVYAAWIGVEPEELSEQAEKYYYGASQPWEDFLASTPVTLIAVDEETYRAYLKEIGISYEEAKDQAILCDQRIDMVDNENGDDVKRVEYDFLKADAGDVLHFMSVEWRNDEEPDSGTPEFTPHSIRVVSRENVRPFGVKTPDTNEVQVIVSRDTLEQIGVSYLNMEILTKDTRKLKEQIQNLDPAVEPYFYDYDELKRENDGMILIISIFLYGFIAVISIIGITNIFNTITTNMALRAREFAVLKSIGMTNREFHRMIRYESILYGTKALLFGVPVGVGLSYWIYRVFGGMYEMPYEIPWKEIGIAAVFVFVIISLTMYYSVKKTEKQNIVETIRAENI